ncbi:hypothetical protein SAMN05443572_107124 [Myxococcus fulvus]|uniref:Outer membrane protein beta-barrel domain-containing protein n=1 Tax=Myxococcus fulvus TaxID=33 RepID=A0A511T733_MYXFU|nr:hypothetical protein [Myxococcus fulvus]GEN09971.1 hypothetical protein MFU01_50080 [Myxococcus fulvus]SEU25573.1 hypothetical protein SAMN05443572_107124 [Myxococcus fulvus]
MAKKHRWTLAVIASLGVSGTAWAQERESGAVEMDVRAAHGMSGPQVAIGVNLGLGLGHVYKDGTSRTGAREDLKITDAANASLPLLAEVGYRLNPRFYVGLWGSWEKVFTKTNDISCPENFDCNNYQWRFGPEVRYHINPASGFDPWVGLSVGMEILKSHVKGDTQVPLPTGGFAPARIDTRVEDRGPTYARISVGGDVRVSNYLALGPIITASVGSYTVRTGEQTVTVTGLPAQTSAVSAVDDGFHALFTLGVRGIFRAF